MSRRERPADERRELGDFGEPIAPQGEADWSKEIPSDDLLDADVRRRLGLRRRLRRIRERRNR